MGKCNGVSVLVVYVLTLKLKSIGDCSRLIALLPLVKIEFLEYDVVKVDGSEV